MNTIDTQIINGQLHTFCNSCKEYKIEMAHFDIECLKCFDKHEEEINNTKDYLEDPLN